MTSRTEQVCANLDDELDRRRGEGWRLDVVYPADNPHTALLSRDGEQLRITSRAAAPGPTAQLPPFAPAAVVSRGDDEGARGRAGMLYRDLIPGRLGGRYIASQIRIPNGGPVADWIHFHRVAVQLICVTEGWVKVVYEGQGEPFVMASGDVVVQPPGIRHQVLQSSAGLSVVEIGCPALHETFADHELALPTGQVERDRRFGGQTFLHHIAAQARWTPFAGGEAQETAVATATGGLAEVRTIRATGKAELDFPEHAGELVFGFVVAGSATLAADRLCAGDAFVIPPQRRWRLCDVGADFRLLHVTTADMPDSLAAEYA